jgi:hypothetical protein
MILQRLHHQTDFTSSLKNNTYFINFIFFHRAAAKLCRSSCDTFLELFKYRSLTQLLQNPPLFSSTTFKYDAVNIS